MLCCSFSSLPTAINGALPCMPAFKTHLRTLPYHDLLEALNTIEASGAIRTANIALRFLNVTAARPGEAQGATWAGVHVDA